MPEEQANPQEPQDTEEEELDLESQLDAVLSQLQALEPDLLPSPEKPPQPEIAQPMVEDTAQVPPPSGSDESAVNQQDTESLESEETTLAAQPADTPVEAEAAVATDGAQSVSNQLDNLISQQIDQEISQEIDQSQTLEPIDEGAAQPVEATETPDDPAAASVAAQPGQDENQAGLSAQQIDALISQEIEQQVDEALSSTPAEAVEPEVAADVPDSDVAGGDANAPEPSSSPPGQEPSTASMIDGLLNEQLAQQIDDAEADESTPDTSAAIAAAEPTSDEPVVAEASSSPTGEDAEDASGTPSTSQQIDDILSQLSGQLTDSEAPEASDAEAESVDAAESASDEPVVAEASSSPVDEDAKDTSDSPSTGQQIDDILAQLSGQLTDSEAQERSDAEPEGVDAAETAGDEATVAEAGEGLSVEQIDALLAQEAEQTVADEFETPSEIKASSETPVDAGDGSDSSASSPEGEQPTEGGFTAGAGDVAAELDDQPENKRRVPQVAKIAAKFKKQDMAGHIVVCKRALWRTCFVINRPLEKIPGPARDAVGYFALAHVMLGSVLILGKLVGIV